MLWMIIKKQALIFWRNPHHLFLLIALPIILIAILGASLGGAFGTETVEIDAKIAFIEHSDEEEQIDLFLDKLAKDSLPKEVLEKIRLNVEEIKPVKRLKEDVFGEIGDNFELVAIKPTEKEKALQDDSYAAVIEIPENFTSDFLETVFLDENKLREIQLYKNEGKQITANVVSSVLQQFQEQYSLFVYTNKNSIKTDELEIMRDEAIGKVTTLEQMKSVNAKSYYAVGMAVMNVLFIAAAIGSFAFEEKKSHVFQRIILSDFSRWVYFLGIFISGSLFAFLQLLIIYAVSWLIFGVTWDNITGFLLITGTLAMSVGGIGVLLTAISFRIDSQIVTNTFQSVVISIFAFLGGSFFPVGELSKTIQAFGNYTPNGASMSAYLSILRGNDLLTIYHHLLFQVVFAFLMIVVAVISFPKRSES